MGKNYYLLTYRSSVTGQEMDALQFRTRDEEGLAQRHKGPSAQGRIVGFGRQPGGSREAKPLN